MNRIHLLPELPPHNPECCSEIVLGWYKNGAFDFMRWFPSSKKWKLVPSGINVTRHRKIVGWSPLVFPSPKQMDKLKVKA